MTSQIAACPNHPTREAIGICVRCRSRLCSECATKVEGINYCVACLAALASRPERPLASERGPLTRHAAALASVLTLALLMWALFELAFAVRPT